MYNAQLWKVLEEVGWLDRYLLPPSHGGREIMMLL
jgi:hypothetical protein